MCQYSDDMLAQMVEPHRIVEIRREVAPTVARAGPIRKVLCDYLASEFGAEAVSHGGGEWSFTGVADQTGFLLNVDFGGRRNGFRYDVTFPPLASVARVGCGLTMESTYGFPTGTWDFLISDELDSLADTLCATIKDIVMLRRLVLPPKDAE